MITADYVAGLIDGEGTLGIHKTHYDRPSPNYAAALAITNTNKKVLDEVALWLNSKSVKVYTMPKKRYSDKHKDCYMLRITNSGLKKLLPLIIDSLIIKRKQAEVLLRFLNTIGITGGRRVPLPKFILQYREDLKQYCSWLNHN